MAPRATAFGLDVWADRQLDFLHGGEAEATGRRLDLLTRATPPELAWPASATLISDERDPKGAVVFQIESAAVGYRISGPYFGSAVVARDGATIAGRPGVGGVTAWQRLLIAQVLPFAAVLRGLEVLHAGAVALDGGAVAIVGRSGAGKTSLAVALSRGRGAFLADDVLALERRDGVLLAHPGPPVAGVARPEAERLRRLGRFDAGAILAEDEREAMMAVAPRPAPTPLRAILVLDRRPDGPGAPRFEAVVGGQELLAATFNLLLLDPERLEGLLDVCALAAAGLVERVSVGPGVDASALARAVERRLGVER
ncbi:MAG: hypothetical protein ACRDPE_20070 [Solirubrobacterales bacterium]